MNNQKSINRDLILRDGLALFSKLELSIISNVKNQF